MIEERLLFQKRNYKKFRERLEYVYNNNKIYREKMDEANINVEDINSISDLVKLPITRKSDFFIDYPYGYYSAKASDIVRYHSSSGTTGKPLIVGLTKNDVKLRNSIVKDICKAIGINKDDVIQVCLGYGMFTGGLSFHEALIDNGYTVIPSSSGSTEKQIFYMQNLHTTVLITSPSYAMHIYEVAKDMGVDVKDLSVRIIKVGSELLTEGMRKKLKSAWGEDVLINQDYGMTETMGPGLAYECKCCNGLHLYTKNFIYELVDPKTKEVVNGNTGELVITSLNNECFPIIRYATNDVVELEMDTCCCGCKAPRIKKIIGRCDDMMKIKGVKIFLSQVEDFILRNKHCTSNYVIELTREDYIDCMTINIEYIEEFDLNNINVSRKLEIIINELVEAFKDKFGIKVNFNFVQPNSIPRHTGKVQRIKDLRNKVDF